jgi:hypothetical protein
MTLLLNMQSWHNMHGWQITIDTGFRSRNRWHGIIPAMLHQGFSHKFEKKFIDNRLQFMVFHKHRSAMTAFALSGWVFDYSELHPDTVEWAVSLG